MADASVKIDVRVGDVDEVRVVIEAASGLMVAVDDRGFVTEDDPEAQRLRDALRELLDAWGRHGERTPYVRRESRVTDA